MNENMVSCNLFLMECNYSSILNNLGKSFAIKECYKKYYHACRHIHAAIDAALYLQQNKNFNIQDIQKIKVTTYPVALKLTQKKCLRMKQVRLLILLFTISLALVKV